MAMSNKIKDMAKEFADTARADGNQYVIVVLKDKQKVRSKDDMHAEVAMDAGTLLSVVCTLIETIVDNTGVPAKTVIRHAKSMIKFAEKRASEMRSSDVE